MADFIKDGTGKGYLAQVDSNNRLQSYAVIEEEPSFINRVEKEMYSAPFNGSIIAASGGNIIAYLKNTSEKDLVISQMKHRCEVASGSVSVLLNVSGTPGGTITAITPANRNAGSNNSANCDLYSSTDITGLSGGRTVAGLFGKVDNEFEFLGSHSGFILPPNATLAVKADNDTSKHYIGMAFYFREIE